MLCYVKRLFKAFTCSVFEKYFKSFCSILKIHLNYRPEMKKKEDDTIIFVSFIT